MSTSRLERLENVLGSLKFRMTMGGVMALVLGIGLITAILTNRAERDLLDAQRQRELGDSARTAALLSRNVLQLQRQLQLVTDTLDEATLRDPAALGRFMQTKPVLLSLFTEIYVATPDGKVLILADATGLSRPTLHLADRAYFQKTLAQGRPLVSEPVQGSISGEPIVVFTQPAHDARGIYAVVGGTLRLTSRDLLDGLVDTQDGDGDALIAVTDMTGRVLAHPSRRLLLKPLREEPRLSQAFEEWTRSGSPMEPLGVTLTQAGEIASAAGVPGPEWMVWRTRPESELLAPFKNAREESLQWAGGLIALLSLALFALLRWLLQPLTLLERRAQYLFDGFTNAKDGWPPAKGEIGRLGKVLRHVGVEREELERVNSETMSKLASVMRAAPVGIAFVRAQRFELVSDELCRLLGLAEKDLLDQPIGRIFAPLGQDDAPQSGLAHEVLQSERAYVGEHRMQRADGSRFWARLRSKPVDADRMGLGTIWTLTNIDEQRDLRAALEWSAAHDNLTGLANRQLFEQRAQRLIAVSPRSIPSALLFIDLDHFKQVNDTGGHATGDAMLRAAAAAIVARVRTGDLAARLGGDEFVLLLERCTHEAALRVAQDIVAAVSEISVPSPSGALRIGASIGVASLTPDIGSVAVWVEAADAACYAAKAAGRGVVRVGSPLAQ